MSATTQRDEVCNLAKVSPREALIQAREIADPWFRAQALSWVARYADSDPIPFAVEAGKAAADCDDDYKRSAVRAWEISALAERGLASEARKALTEALTLAQAVTPQSSRSEALFLLMQAAFKLGENDAKSAYQVLTASCDAHDHWRCKRAICYGERLFTGQYPPRQFFW